MFTCLFSYSEDAKKRFERLDQQMSALTSMQKRNVSLHQLIIKRGLNVVFVGQFRETMKLLTGDSSTVASSNPTVKLKASGGILSNKGQLSALLLPI
jgi:hypothetical protein